MNPHLSTTIDHDDIPVSPDSAPHVVDKSRRSWLKAGAAFSAHTALRGLGVMSPLMVAMSSQLAGCATANQNVPTPKGLSFSPVKANSDDAVTVPIGYTYSVLYRWGDPIGHTSQPVGQPAFKPDGSNTATEQALQAGMHHDGMHFFPLPNNPTRGLLVMNHEYSDEVLLNGSTPGWSVEKTRKSQAAHGVSVIEIERMNAGWQVIRPSPYARRITAMTPIRIAGPAAGHPNMRTAADPQGAQVIGTFNNCAMGYTPWGTYLTCEENIDHMFQGGTNMTPAMRRFGLRQKATNQWFTTDERFDVARHPNEPNRFGWVVEIDPFDPASTPVKRTSMGRFKHEGAALSTCKDGRVAYYMGDDQIFEYFYKFVSRDAVRPGGYKANADLLDHGILYVAVFDDKAASPGAPNGMRTGRWMPVVFGQGPLTQANGFTDQGDVLINTRRAADYLGATKMDRCEWAAVHPISKEVYVTCTNNSQRGRERLESTNVANPRAPNRHGHIVRLIEAGNDPSALTFTWELALLGGAANNQVAGYREPSNQFSCPDGLHFDQRGLLWVQTDMSARAMGKGEYEQFCNNSLLAYDPTTRDLRRFLVGPPGCEITGTLLTADARSMFVNIQHPGESSDDDDVADWSSNWPGPATADAARRRPRSATIVVSRIDGGVIG